MTQFKLPLLAGLAAAAVLSLGSPALAVTAAKPAATVAAKPAVKVAAKPAVKVAAKPAVKVAAKPAFKAHPAALHAKPAATGRVVTARQSNGKTVTYNCSLAGNQTKQACKR